MKFLKMLTSTRFLINASIAVLLVTGLVWGTLTFLDYYTMHGETIAVPDFSGLKEAEIEKIIEDKKLRYSIVDSVFVTEMPKGTAVAQDPPPSSLVKKNRTIYITMNSFHPPRIGMPRLTDRSMREVVIIMENIGLRIGDIKTIPAICPGCVLNQLYQGKDIEEGELIPKGAVIDLVVGMGISNDKIRTPLMVDLTMDSAIRVLNMHTLLQGAIVYDETILTEEDSINARVYRQEPQYSENSIIPLGSSVDLWFTVDTTKIDNKLRENYVNDTTIITSIKNDSLQKPAE